MSTFTDEQLSTSFGSSGSGRTLILRGDGNGGLSCFYGVSCLYCDLKLPKNESSLRCSLDVVAFVTGDGIPEVVTVPMVVVVPCLFRSFGELDGVGPLISLFAAIFISVIKMMSASTLASFADKSTVVDASVPSGEDDTLTLRCISAARSTKPQAAFRNSCARGLYRPDKGVADRYKGTASHSKESDRAHGQH
jgi:hypothetical protein